MGKSLKNLIIFGILLISFIILSAVYIYSKSNITVIQVPLSDSTLKQKTFSEFLKGQKITGEFISNQNYLGQVLVRFYNYHRINSDSVIFRIKEKGGISWYYQNTYKTDQFIPDALFTFGFPIIPDSKNKTYYFEIESVEGKPEDAVTLSQQSPMTEVIYQYPKSLLIRDPNTLSEFIKNDVSNIEINRDLIVAVVAYLDFILIILFLEYLLIKNLKFSLRRIDGSHPIILGLITLVFSSILLYLKKQGFSEILTIIGYFLIIIGVGWYLIESKVKSR